KPILMEVLKAAVNRPQPHRIGNNTLYFYPVNATPGRRLIPLEIVFRFGMPSGSSLPQRLARDPAYARTLGLKNTPEIGTFFEHPVLEFYTKLEPKDRLLSLQEATLVSGLNAQQFENLVELSLDIAMALYFIFADRSIELWDGKIEMVVDEDGTLMLADSVGPDELRLLFDGCHLSKEMIRQIYRGSPWEQSIKDAQERAAQSGDRSWKEIVIEDLGQQPEPLKENLKSIIDQLYGSITNHVLKTEVIAEQPSLKDFVRQVPAYLLSMPASGVRFT
ncbi:MAG TPA: phosphoribosylaminoimidazolesuccinocarboxamide synthase, partial [Chroococcales cyanobacterium]